MCADVWYTPQPLFFWFRPFCFPFWLLDFFPFLFMGFFFFLEFFNCLPCLGFFDFFLFLFLEAFFFGFFPASLPLLGFILLLSWTISFLNIFTWKESESDKKCGVDNYSEKKCRVNNAAIQNYLFDNCLHNLDQFFPTLLRVLRCRPVVNVKQNWFVESPL